MRFLRDKLTEVVTDLAEDLKQKHIDLGMKASGDWLDSVEVVVEEYSAYILANDYTEQLIQGRAPGKQPPINPLKKWAEAKFGVSSGESTSIAWAVATKIKNEGTDYHPEGTDLLDGVLTEQRYNDIINELADFVTISVSEDLIRGFNELGKVAA